MPIGVWPIPDVLFNASLALRGQVVLLDLLVSVDVVGNDYMSCHCLNSFHPSVWDVSRRAFVSLSAENFFNLAHTFAAAIKMLANAAKALTLLFGLSARLQLFDDHLFDRLIRDAVKDVAIRHG